MKREVVENKTRLKSYLEFVSEKETRESATTKNKKTIERIYNQHKAVFLRLKDR
jgi:hypothetical protein